VWTKSHEKGLQAKSTGREGGSKERGSSFEVSLWEWPDGEKESPRCTLENPKGVLEVGIKKGGILLKKGV